MFQIPLYNPSGMVLTTVPVEFATRNEGAFLRLVRNKRQKVTRAYIKCLPGFMRHVVAAYIGDSDDEKPISARYGMSYEQHLASGHVVHSLRGVVGSAH